MLEQCSMRVTFLEINNMIGASNLPTIAIMQPLAEWADSTSWKTKKIRRNLCRSYMVKGRMLIFLSRILPYVKLHPSASANRGILVFHWMHQDPVKALIANRAIRCRFISFVDHMDAAVLDGAVDSTNKPAYRREHRDRKESSHESKHD